MLFGDNRFNKSYNKHRKDTYIRKKSLQWSLIFLSQSTEEHGRKDNIETLYPICWVWKHLVADAKKVKIDSKLNENYMKKKRLVGDLKW